MRKALVIVAAVLAGMGVSAVAPYLVQAAAPGGGGPALRPMTPVAANTDDLPNRTAKAFAPFIRAIVTRRMNQAQRMFKLRRSVMANLEGQNTVRILGKFAKPDQLELNLIGGRVLGKDIGTLLFTVATEDGPVAFKINYYGFGQDTWISHMDVTDEWEELERLSTTVDPLMPPLTVGLATVPEEPANGVNPGQ